MTEVHGVAALYVVDALTDDETEEFENHLAGCVACQEEVAEMRNVTVQLTRSVEADPPAALRSAVLESITRTPQEAAAERDEDPTTRQPVDARATGADNVVDLRRRAPSKVPYLVAAAAVLFALGFGGWGLQSRQDAQQASDQHAEIVSLLGAADVRTVSASGPGGSSATVVVSQDAAKAVFVVSGMPALSEDEVYELWTVHGTAVPAGTFGTVDETTLVTLPDAALSANQIAVTVEPEGGSQHPTSKPIMSLPVPKAT